MLRGARIARRAAALLALGGATIALAACGSGGGKPQGAAPSTTSAPATTTTAPAQATGGGAGATAGLQTGPAPWPPEYAHLAERLQALSLPAPSDTAFHIHALLVIYVDGRRVPVPADVGIDPQGRFIAPLHTHDDSGIVHIESVRRYPFTLGQFFTVWGVKLTRDQLGTYRDGSGKRLALYVDGKRVADPVNYVMRRHDVMILGYGKPGSFPTKLKIRFPPGL